GGPPIKCLLMVTFTVLHTGLIDGDDVTQNDTLWKFNGDSATIDCSHTKGAGYFQMYWYRQLPGEGMKQIVFTTTTPPHKYESGFSEDKFPAQKNDPQTGSLTLNSSAVYFCAARLHSATYHCSSVQKPPQHILSSRYYSSQPLAPVCFPFMRW
uniref:Ig-like domain-containing protein n=1 Tax=Dicentrarchus labrax TaxID=13489 RepID=A0A8P4K9V1_DICLA